MDPMGNVYGLFFGGLTYPGSTSHHHDFANPDLGSPGLRQAYLSGFNIAGLGSADLLVKTIATGPGKRPQSRVPTLFLGSTIGKFSIYSSINKMISYDNSKRKSVQQQPAYYVFLE